MEKGVKKMEETKMNEELQIYLEAGWITEQEMERLKDDNRLKEVLEIK